MDLWSGRRDSNPRQPAWKAGTLPTELLPHISHIYARFYAKPPHKSNLLTVTTALFEDRSNGQIGIGEAHTKEHAILGQLGFRIEM